jgi:hypothetical protein
MVNFPISKITRNNNEEFVLARANNQETVTKKSLPLCDRLQLLKNSGVRRARTADLRVMNPVL